MSMLGFFSGKDMTDSILAEIIHDRRDHAFLVNNLTDAYTGTFTHTTMEPLTDMDRNIRTFLEGIFMTMRNAHVEVVGDPEYDGRNMDMYLNDWRNMAFNAAKAQWSELTGVDTVEVEGDEDGISEA